MTRDTKDLAVKALKTMLGFTETNMIRAEQSAKEQGQDGGDERLAKARREEAREAEARALSLRRAISDIEATACDGP